MCTSAEPPVPQSVYCCEAVVVGGGPAGCAAAHVLARAGLEVLLVEREGPQRDKACGDMFVPPATAVLQRLGLDSRALLAAGGRPFDAVDLLGNQGPLWKVNYASNPVWIIPRRFIDQALRDSLPPEVRVLYKRSVVNISFGSDELDLTTQDEAGVRASLRAQGVVLASGAGDPLPLRWGVSGARLLAPSITAYACAPRISRPAFEFSNRCRPGYRWLFPTQDGPANVGICSLEKVSGSKLKALAGTLMQEYEIAEDIEWRGGVGALWSGVGERWHHPTGLVACGDAAGLVDPFNGEGLTAALTSGEAAGASLTNFLLHDRDVASLRNYSHWVKASFGAAYAPSPLRDVWKFLCGIRMP